MTTVATKGADVKTATFTPGRHHRGLPPTSPTHFDRATGWAGWPAASSFRWATSATPRRPRAPSPPSTGSAGRSPATRPPARRRQHPNCSAGTRSPSIPAGEDLRRGSGAGGRQPSGHLRRGGDRPALGRWGSEVVAVVQFARGKTATDEELEAACRAHIADYKVPKASNAPITSRSPRASRLTGWLKRLPRNPLRATRP